MVDGYRFIVKEEAPTRPNPFWTPRPLRGDEGGPVLRPGGFLRMGAWH